MYATNGKMNKHFKLELFNKETSCGSNLFSLSYHDTFHIGFVVKLKQTCQARL